MSIEAMSVALNVAVGHPTRKMVLVGIANHAHRDGTAAYAKIKTYADYAECSARTAQRHVAVLLEDGFIREGDQRLVQHIPVGSRPIVYDVAMTAEQRAEWSKSNTTPGRRAASAEIGSKGGQRSAQVRRGDNLSPLTEGAVDTKSAQVARGDNLTPPMGGAGGDTGDTPGGDTHDTPGGDTGVTLTVPMNRPNEPKTYPPTPRTAPDRGTTAGAAAVDGVLALEDRAIEVHGEEQAAERAPLFLVEDLPEATATFDDFWAAYPRKDDKQAAIRAWNRAVKKAPPAEIVAAAQRYREDPNRDPGYTKHGATWLNAGAWENGPLPPKMVGGRPSAYSNEALGWDTSEGADKTTPLTEEELEAIFASNK